jgi:hypothetical protein
LYTFLLPFFLLAFDVNGQTNLIFVFLCNLLCSSVLLVYLIHRLFDSPCTISFFCAMHINPLNIQANRPFSFCVSCLQIRAKIVYWTVRVSITIFIVVPCILIILKFFSPTNANFIKHIKY